MKNSFLVAVTGGIGSGKTTVLNALSSLGEKTLNCDGLTGELYNKPCVKRWLKNKFPNAVSGKIFLKVNKPEISKIVFNAPDKLAQLTNYLTPKILALALKRARAIGGRVFVEVPLLFECNKEDSFNKVIVVTRNLDSRISSVMTRSNLTKDEVLKRISSQFDYDNADLSKYILLPNDGDQNTLTEKLTAIINQL